MFIKMDLSAKRYDPIWGRMSHSGSFFYKHMTSLRSSYSFASISADPKHLNQLFNLFYRFGNRSLNFGRKLHPQFLKIFD